MTVEEDLEGKDLTVYGDVFSGGHPVETDITDLLDPAPDTIEPIPAQPPIETIEGREDAHA